MSEAASNTLKKVSDEFLAEVLAQLTDGRNQSADLLEAARKETEETVSRILETGKKQAVSAKRQLIDSAELETRNLHLKELEVAVNEVFSEGVRRLPGLSAEERERALNRLVREGVQVIGQKATVSCNAADKKILSSIIRTLNKEGVKLTLGQESIQSIGGVVLSSPDGSVRFDNTYESRLERMRQILRKEIANTLDGRERPAASATVAPNHD